MVNKWRTWFLAVALAGMVGPAFAQTIDLKVGSVTVDPADLTAASCIQVPILINDNLANRDLVDLSFVVEITGDTGIIAGGVAANMTVFNGLQGVGAGSATGITNPATDLSNNTAAGATPTCTASFNQATQGSGPAIDFFLGASNGSATINNNQGGVGRKQGFVFNAGGGNIAALTGGTDLLIAVIEIPITAGPAPSQLIVTATPNSVVADGNAYTWDDGTRNNDGSRALINEEFGLGQAQGVVNIFAPEDCAGATLTDNVGSGGTGAAINIGYLDPQAGGVGGDITFTIPHSANVDQIRITGTDGYMNTVPATGTSTTVTINTQGDGSPATGAASVTYQAFLGIEFPAASGTFAEGAACSLTATWEAPSCTVVFDATPVVGQATNVDVTMTNVVYDAGNTRFGVLTGPNALSVNLAAATSVAGNVLTFDNAHPIASVAATDVGSYDVATVTGPSGATSNCSVFLGLACPTNNVNCANIPGNLQIGGMVAIPLAGDNVATWDITYNGTTTNLPGSTASFDLMNLVGNQTQVTITANGFDAMGQPCTDVVTCDLAFANPTCTVTTGFENPSMCPGGVDFGTAVAWSIETTNGISVNLPTGTLTPDVDPNTNFNVVWTGNVTIDQIGVITATVNGPTGTTADTTCTYESCINCFAMNVQLSGNGISFEGVPNLTYEIWAAPGQCVDVSTPIAVGSIPGATQVGSVTTNASGMGEGVFGSGVTFVQDSCYYVVCTPSLAVASSGVITVPTLGEWGLIAFLLLMMAGGVVMMRRNKQRA